MPDSQFVIRYLIRIGFAGGRLLRFANRKLGSRIETLEFAEHVCHKRFKLAQICTEKREKLRDNKHLLTACLMGQSSPSEQLGQCVTKIPLEFFPSPTFYSATTPMQANALFLSPLFVCRLGSFSSLLSSQAPARSAQP